VTLDELNTASADDAFAAFMRCCGSSRWADGMTAARPFASVESMMVTGDVIWSALDRADWLEAFASHPRIGESHGGQGGQSGLTPGQWSAQEQAGVADADAAVKERLAGRNRDYEARFGYIFIVCATGKSASDMLDILERRLTHDPGQELPIAADEQRRITRLRLAKLSDR